MDDKHCMKQFFHTRLFVLYFSLGQHKLGMIGQMNVRASVIFFVSEIFEYGWWPCVSSQQMCIIQPSEFSLAGMFPQLYLLCALNNLSNYPQCLVQMANYSLVRKKQNWNWNRNVYEDKQDEWGEQKSRL